MSTITINVKANAYYSGTVPLDGYMYEVTVRWNLNTEKWYMDLVGLNNDVDIKNIGLLPGKDLLAPYGYIELGTMYLIDNSGAGENPNYADIGGRFTLEYTEVV